MAKSDLPPQSVSESERPAQDPAQLAGHPPNMAVFSGIVAASVVIIAVLLVVFPNIVHSSLILALTVLTPLVGGLSFALTRSGLRRRLPRSVTNGIRVGLGLIVAADLYILVVPLFVSGPTGHDTTPTFVATNTAPAAASAPAATAVASATAVPTSAAVLSGTFVNGGQGDTVSGTATLGVTTTGQVELAFTNFASSNGPDVFVYLSKVAGPTTSAQVMDGFEVGLLKATSGQLSYTLPASLDIGQYKSVVVYCRSFSIIFGYASLR